MTTSKERAEVLAGSKGLQITKDEFGILHARPIAQGRQVQVRYDSGSLICVYQLVEGNWAALARLIEKAEVI